MNSSSFNGATINGAFGDATVRSYVNLIATAFIVANARVLRKSIVNIEARADIGPVVGRAYMRSMEVVIAQAVINPGYRVYVKFNEVCQAIADITITARNQVRNVATLSAAASITLTARNRARSVVTLQAYADIVARVLSRIRSAVSVTGQAQIENTATVKAPTPVLSPVGVSARAQIQAAGYVRRRDAIDLEANALVVARLSARIRGPVICYASANILAQFEVYRRLPFDRNAPDERTYVVPAIQTYYVVT